MSSLDERRKAREGLLVALANQGGKRQDVRAAIKTSGVSEDDALGAVDYLEGEGLLETKSWQQPGLVQLTHSGLVAAEELEMKLSRSASGTSLRFDSPEERQAARLAYMKLAYERSSGSPNALFEYAEIGRELGLSDEATQSVLSYLTEKGLLKLETYSSISITTWGIDEVEELMRNPEQPTDNLPAPASINVMIVREMYGSQVQQGSTSSVQQQKSGLGHEEIEALRSVLEEYRRAIENPGIDELRRREAEAELQTIEAQLSSPSPKPRILVESLHALRSIAEGMGAAVAAEAVMHALKFFGT
jgi:hypothetical protein